MMKKIKSLQVKSEIVEISPKLKTTTFKLITTIEGNEKIECYFDYSFFITQYYYWITIQSDLPDLPSLNIFQNVPDKEYLDDDSDDSDDEKEVKKPKPKRRSEIIREGEKQRLSGITSILQKAIESKKLLKDRKFQSFLFPNHANVQTILGGKKKPSILAEKKVIEEKPFMEWSHKDVIDWFTSIGCPTLSRIFQSSLHFTGKDFVDPNFYNATIFISLGGSVNIEEKDEKKKDVVVVDLELEKYIFKSEYHRVLLTKVYRKRPDIDVIGNKKNLFIEFIDLKHWDYQDIFCWLKEVNLYKDYKDFFVKNRILGSDLLQHRDDIFIKSFDLKKPLEKRKFFKMYVDQIINSRIFSKTWLKIQDKLKEFTSFSTPEKIDFTDTLDNKEKFLKKYLNKEELMKKIDVPFKNTFEKKIKVKLILTDQLRTEGQKNLRSLISPFYRLLPGTFGMFHTAIIVGPYYLQWSTNEIVVPKTFESYKAFFAADIKEISVEDGSLDRVVDKLADVCLKWNKNFSYSQNGMKKNTGNCQNFVNDVFKNLKISVKFQGVLKKFFESIRTTGKTDMVFEPSKQFVKRFNLKKKKFVFKTHRELDDFASDITYLHLPEFSEERFLLKAFDRSFWLRHFKDPDDPNFQPSSKNGCYFKNPKLTGSYF